MRDMTAELTIAIDALKAIEEIGSNNLNPRDQQRKMGLIAQEALNDMMQAQWVEDDNIAQRLEW